MSSLVKMVDDGVIRSPKVTTYPFENVVESHKDIESGTTVGKLVLLTKNTQ
jgi:NADPH:quinone reductase-like Zn-dependent oxidoreductase